MGNLSELRHFRDLSGSRVKRLLLPIDASEEAGWGIRHAIRLAEAGEKIEVCLVYVIEQVRNWEVLRFHSGEEVALHFSERAAVFLARSASALAAAGIPSQSGIFEFGRSHSLGELARELHCSAIVMPHCRWLGRFPYGPWRRLARTAGTTPVIETTSEGLPA